MEPISSMHSYPLTTLCASIVCHRTALVGDAAVGMHPVTAHGFNLGIAAVRHLTDEILPLLERGADPTTLRRSGDTESGIAEEVFRSIWRQIRSILGSTRMIA
ncbi:MAG: hypothetical protein IPF48_14110 [Sphingomonadales bacterium]|nr:hypothetical protein [Sphingomonadales bacterium]